MAQTPKPRSPAWWNRQEGQLRKYIGANPTAQDETFDELYIGVQRHGVGGCIPKAELAALCRLLGVKTAEFPVAHK